jgi:hypothetical protein
MLYESIMYCIITTPDFLHLATATKGYYNYNDANHRVSITEDIEEATKFYFDEIGTMVQVCTAMQILFGGDQWFIQSI